jgi:hypothetical protein
MVPSAVHCTHFACRGTGKANTGIGRDAPDVAPLDKGGLTSQIRNENFDEGCILHIKPFKSVDAIGGHFTEHANQADGPQHRRCGSVSRNHRQYGIR